MPPTKKAAKAKKPRAVTRVVRKVEPAPKVEKRKAPPGGGYS